MSSLTRKTGNNKPPYAVRLQMPFDKPYSDQEWFDSLPIPPYWELASEDTSVDTIEYLLHPLKETAYTLNTPVIEWPTEVNDYFGQVDLCDNEVSWEFIHPRFLQMLDDRGLQILAWDVFITPPKMMLKGHKDTDTETVKLNFAYQFYPDISQQNYLKEIGDSNILGIPDGDRDVKDVMENGSVIHYHNVANDWSKPSLTNVGLWHEVVNGSIGPRICLSYQLKRKQDTYASLWYDVYPLLEDLIVEE